MLSFYFAFSNSLPVLLVLFPFFLISFNYLSFFLSFVLGSIFPLILFSFPSSFSPLILPSSHLPSVGLFPFSRPSLHYPLPFVPPSISICLCSPSRHSYRLPLHPILPLLPSFCHHSFLPLPHSLSALLSSFILPSFLPRPPNIGFLSTISSYIYIYLKTYLPQSILLDAIIWYRLIINKLSFWSKFCHRSWSMAWPPSIDNPTTRKLASSVGKLESWLFRSSCSPCNSPWHSACNCRSKCRGILTMFLPASAKKHPILPRQK